MKSFCRKYFTSLCKTRLGASKTRGSEQDENGDLLDVVYKRMEGKGSESIELVDMNFS